MADMDYSVKTPGGEVSAPRKGAEVFKVNGAGILALSTNGIAKCGGAVGISIGCSWGRFGYTGGVIDVLEIRSMRDALDKWLAEHGDKCCAAQSPKFEKTHCSQCGREFGPGNSGYSHCEDHLSR